MRKPLIFALATAFIACTALSGCAADGSFASKAKPVDASVTLQKVCHGVQGADIAAKGILVGLIAAQKADPEDLQIEAAAKKVFDNFCDPNKPPTDMTGAALSVGAAAVDLGNLLAKLDGKSGGAT